MLTNERNLGTKTIINRVAMAEEVGCRILVHQGVNRIHKSAKFEGLYDVGDVLTVKAFSTSRHEYSHNFHIHSVEEFPTPEGVKVIITPSEYVVLKVRFDLSDPSPEDLSPIDDSYDFRYRYYCPVSRVLWETSSLSENKGKVMSVTKNFLNDTGLECYWGRAENVI